MDEGREFFENRLCTPENYPVSFTYAGKDYKGLGELTLVSKEIKDTPAGKESVLTFDLDGGLELKAAAAFNAEFGENEYTLWFENRGSAPSGVLENVLSASLDLPGADPVLRGCLGDHGNKYAAYEKDLLEAPVEFKNTTGRATHVYFPYFDLVHGDGGTLMALGWAGNWAASFVSLGETTRVEAANCDDFRACLLPGEKVRSAMVVLLPYKGRNADDATNLWREWFVKYNLPRADGQGNPIEPFSTSCFAGDTGLPNSDGSISERFYTWKRTLERLVYEDVIPDFRWFDAGWYPDPAGNTVMSEWWSTIGTWEIDKVKWPGNTFRESNDACHKAGMKVLMWFEPERVTHIEDLVRNHGYKEEWAISNDDGVSTNNLGDPDCLDWTVERITRTMLEGGVDLFREDNNSDPGTTWPLRDAVQDSNLGIPRRGITENLAVQGHYELWDRIIAFCAANGKCTFIDNCASGGGRNDIESLRRSLPFLRSDSDRTTTALRLSMSSTFNKWIPLSGSSTKESVHELEGGQAGGSDFYVTRASWLPIYNLSELWTHDVMLDYDRVRKTYNEWKAFNHLLTKDFYVLTPWHAHYDNSGWTVFVYNDRETGEGILTAFRQETNEEPEFAAKLPFAKAGETYSLENVDTGEKLTLDGGKLSSEGLSIVLDAPRSCAVWHILRSR